MKTKKHRKRKNRARNKLTRVPVTPKPRNWKRTDEINCETNWIQPHKHENLATCYEITFASQFMGRERKAIKQYLFLDVKRTKHLIDTHGRKTPEAGQPNSHFCLHSPNRCQMKWLTVYLGKLVACTCVVDVTYLNYNLANYRTTSLIFPFLC